MLLFILAPCVVGNQLPSKRGVVLMSFVPLMGHSELVWQFVALPGPLMAETTTPQAAALRPPWLIDASPR